MYQTEDLVVRGHKDMCIPGETKSDVQPENYKLAWQFRALPSGERASILLLLQERHSGIYILFVWYTLRPTQRTSSCEIDTSLQALTRYNEGSYAAIGGRCLQSHQPLHKIIIAQVRRSRERTQKTRRSIQRAGGEANVTRRPREA